MQALKGTAVSSKERHYRQRVSGEKTPVALRDWFLCVLRRRFAEKMHGQPGSFPISASWLQCMLVLASFQLRLLFWKSARRDGPAHTDLVQNSHEGRLDREL